MSRLNNLASRVGCLRQARTFVFSQPSDALNCLWTAHITLSRKYDADWIFTPHTCWALNCTDRSASYMHTGFVDLYPASLLSSGDVKQSPPHRKTTSSPLVGSKIGLLWWSQLPVVSAYVAGIPLFFELAPAKASRRFHWLSRCSCDTAVRLSSSSN